MGTAMLETAKVMPKGQVTIPADIRKQLGVSSGDKVVFVSDGERVIVANAAVYALETLQHQMAGVAESVGWASEDDVAEFITSLRRGEA